MQVFQLLLFLIHPVTILVTYFNKIKLDHKINQVFCISTTREISVNRINLQAPTLVAPLGQTQDLEPQAVQHPDNRPYVFEFSGNS